MNTILQIVGPNDRKWSVVIKDIVNAEALRACLEGGELFIPDEISWRRFCPQGPQETGEWHRIKEIEGFDGGSPLPGWHAKRTLEAFKKAHEECWGKPDPDGPSELQYQIFLLQYLLSPLSLLEDLAMALHDSGLSEVSRKIGEAIVPVEKLARAIRDLLDSRTFLQCRARYWEKVDNDER